MNRRISGLVFAVFGAQRAVAAPTVTVPASHIPPAVVAELNHLENQFDLALAQDCAPEQCFSKGCSYLDHAVVDKPRSASLPGFGDVEGPGAVNPQEFLTKARCEFAHEDAIAVADVQALAKRMSQKLSKGWLVVTVANQKLQPVSETVREAPVVTEDGAEEPAPEVVTPVPQAWEWSVALRELWVNLLPHFAWMIAVVLGTLAALIVIWGLRRVGHESLEEKALLAQLANPPAMEPPPPPEPLAPPPPEPDAKSLADRSAEQAFVGEHRQRWLERIASANLDKGTDGIGELMREWLAAGEFGLLAKAILVFSDHLALSLPSDGELAVRKLEFAEFLRNVDEERLPSDADFFRKLNHHAISTSILAQSDADVMRNLRQEFGSSGIARLIDTLPPRYGALLFALAPSENQHEIARMLPPELRQRVAAQLLLSNRISKDETAHLFAALRAAHEGHSLPAAPEDGHLLDRGPTFDAAGSLSVVLPHIAQADRSSLFLAALQRSSGSLPLWYEEILFPDMLLKVPENLQTDMLLDVDIRALAGWYSLQDRAWQEGFVARLSPSLRNALLAAKAFGSRADQLTLARQGRVELATALQKLVARGQVAFADVLV